MKKVGLFIASAICVASASICGCTDSGTLPKHIIPTKELVRLDKTLNEAALYQRRANIFADSVKKELRRSDISESECWSLTGKLAIHYRPRMADSALVYSQKALALSEKLGKNERFQSKLFVTDALSASGFFSGALINYDSLDISSADPELKIHYWQTGRRLYGNLCNYIGEEDQFYDEYRSKYMECDDSLIRNLPESSSTRAFIISERYVYQGKINAARKKLESLMTKLPQADNLYGMTAYQLALVYQSDDPTRYATYLAIAAESDIRGAIRDGYALPALATWLYKERQFKSAFQYINFALEEAYKGNARMRMVKISRWMPQIDEAYREEQNSSRRHLMGIAVMVSIFFLALIFVILFLLKEIKRRRETMTVITSISKLKDTYIRDFISLCSVYSEKYDNLAKTVSSKVSSGHAQDLLKIVKYGKISEQENEDFYRAIDSVFRNLYPDFIEKINSLLMPEQRFDIPADGSLTPELRIYGFVRLGVTESSKIARILNYSVNTVYAYRNRMRNRALDHDGFDEAVMRIDSGDFLIDSENETAKPGC